MGRARTSVGGTVSFRCETPGNEGVFELCEAERVRMTAAAGSEISLSAAVVSLIRRGAAAPLQAPTAMPTGERPAHEKSPLAAGVSAAPARGSLIDQWAQRGREVDSASPFGPDLEPLIRALADEANQAIDVTTKLAGVDWGAVEATAAQLQAAAEWAQQSAHADSLADREPDLEKYADKLRRY